jgi:thiosulfate/3-mercaptopyruvate sulfurtransferase
MAYQTLIQVHELAPHLADSSWRVIDCRFDLDQPDAGRSAYLEAHIPGAAYVSLDDDLSASPQGSNGRHPLPDAGSLNSLFSHLGIDGTTQVVAYDGGTDGYAARAWWLLRYMGHSAAAVLEGGWQGWRQLGMPASQGWEAPEARPFKGKPQLEMVISAAEILDDLPSREIVLVDSRAVERYRGEQEPYDPVAGRIPGAVNRPWRENLDSDSRLRPSSALRQEFEAVLSGCPPTHAAVYCGSGVTACQNLLVMEHIGLGGARLYPGSWSEWCADPGRPVARG